MSAKPHFFQPLIPGFEDRFCIPVSFFKNLKGLECDILTLRSPCGNFWPIKINGRQFSDGWKQFVQDHDLHIGDFLLFRHDGGLVFDVVVFDRSTCERKYTPFVPVQEEESEDPPFVPVKEEETEIQQGNVPVCTRSGKKMKRKKKAKTRVKVKASSVPEHPNPSCVIKLTPDSIKKNRLYIPREFARENDLNGRSCPIILKDEEANCWRGTLLYTSDKKLVISGGWKAYRSVYKLKAGDSLMVELIKKGEMPVFQIRKLQEHLEFTWEPTCQNNAKASEIPEVAKVSGSEYKAFSGKKQAAALPHFYVNMQIFYNINSQKIPKNFAERHGLGECSAVTIKNEIGKSWLVLLRLDHNTNEVYMTGGWIDFVRENGIQGADVFMLELVKGGTRPEMKYYGLNQEMEDIEDVKPII